MRIVGTGGAGFVGSHLCDALLARCDSVVCLDNFSTGRPDNVAHLAGRPGFELIQCDVSAGIDVDGPVGAVAHLASAASPPDYQRLPLETLAAGSRGTENALRLAEAKGARFLLASTSEVYGDPAVHPQTEEYWGHVNPIGPRSVYDEAKRFAEALTCAYHRAHGLDARIVRIFNTYGPRMRAGDGRVIPQFITHALSGIPLPIHGDGRQTRSFCFLDDLVDGIFLIATYDALAGGGVQPRQPHQSTPLLLAGKVPSPAPTTPDNPPPPPPPADTLPPRARTPHDPAP